MKINEIINEAESPYANLSYKPLEVTVTDKKPDDNAPPVPKGPSVNIDDLSPEELDAIRQDLEKNDPGIEPVAIVPALGALKRIGLVKKGIDAVGDIVRKRRNKADEPEAPAPVRRQDNKKKADRRKKDRDPERYAPDYSDGVGYEIDPDLATKAAEWYRRTQG